MFSKFLFFLVCCSSVCHFSTAATAQNHAGVIVRRRRCHDSSCHCYVHMLPFLMCILTILRLERGWWKSGNVNLQKKEQMYAFFFFFFLFKLWPKCHVLPPLSPKCLYKESRWMTNTCSAVAYHSVYVWEGEGGWNPMKLMSMLAKMTTLLLFTFPCVSGVRWWSWILYPVD